MLKKVNKSGESLDETAKKAKMNGILSARAILATFLLYGLPRFGYLVFVTLLAAPILGINAMIKANRILENSDSTEAQRKLAKQGRFLGILSLIITVGICVFVGIVVSNFTWG